MFKTFKFLKLSLVWNIYKFEHLTLFRNSDFVLRIPWFSINVFLQTLSDQAPVLPSLRTEAMIRVDVKQL